MNLGEVFLYSDGQQERYSLLHYFQQVKGRFLWLFPRRHVFKKGINEKTGKEKEKSSSTNRFVFSALDFYHIASLEHIGTLFAQMS